MHLEHGRRMELEQFLSAWESMPDLKRAELIEGVVHLASPVSFSHGVAHAAIIWLVKTYAIAARYCIAASNATWIVQPDALQPDVILAVRPDLGGRSRLQGRYLTGAPELVVEISVTSQALDKGPKLALHQRAGVQEYVTIEPVDRTVVWRELVDGSYRAIEPGADGGVYRSRVFPGLWFDSEAFWRDDGEAMESTLRLGLAQR